MAKINITKFRTALKNSMGSITNIAKSCGVDRNTIYAFIEKHPQVKKDIENEIARIQDLAENNMKIMALQKNFKALKFFLERKCGWTPKQEIDMKTENKTEMSLEEAYKKYHEEEENNESDNGEDNKE